MSSKKPPAIDYNNPLDQPFSVGTDGLVPPEHSSGRDPEKIRRLDALTGDMERMRESMNAAQEEVTFTWTCLGMQAFWLSASALALRSAFRVNPDTTLARKYFSNARVCQLLSAGGLFGLGVGTSTLSMLPKDVAYWRFIRDAAADLDVKYEKLREDRKALMVDLKMDLKPLGSK
jgi:hypothetical protein